MANIVRCLLGDFGGNVVDEIAILPDEVVERLGNVGRVKFSVPWRDEVLQAGLLEPGRTLLLQFDNGLPDWGGVIDLPQKWDGQRVEIVAYSGEYLLGWRYTDKGRYFDGATPGAIFAALVDEANAVDDTGIQLGSVYAGGGNHSPEYHFKQVLGTIQDSVTGRLSNYEFAVIASLEGSRIIFTANFYQQRGRLVTAALVQGENLAEVVLNRQGPILNDIAIAGADVSGEGSDGWGDGRITAAAADAQSINQYRRRQYGAVFNDVSEPTTLEGHAARLLADNKAPFNAWDLTAIDKTPGRFADYGVGDTVRLLAPHYGIGGTDTYVRVLGRDYKPAAGVCALVVREVVDDA